MIAPFPNQDFNFKLYEVRMPVGSVIAFAGNLGKDNSSPPQGGHSNHPIEAHGWMICDGRSLTVSMYPELFASLGYLYGGSNDKFNIPDLQGVFLRGIGSDQASLENRNAPPGGTTSGVGSSQKDAMQTHKHSYNEPTGASPGKSGAAFAATKPTLTSEPTDNIASPPGKIKVSQYETRPVNVFVYHLIKYTNRLPVQNIFNANFK